MFIFSNLATSLDGKIGLQSRGLFLLGTPEDRKQMQVLRRDCDAILIGASTFKSHPEPIRLKTKSALPIHAVLSSKLQGISPRWKYFVDKNPNRLFFVGHEAASSRIRQFEKYVEIIQLKKPSRRSTTAFQIIQALDKKGVKRLLIEGGGGLMWDFVSQNWIDEYHVTLTPKILGGAHSPTLVDGTGFSKDQILNLKLLSSRMIGDEIFLVYRKTEPPQRKR